MREVCGADVVTGTVTGEPPSLEQIQQAQEGADKTPVLIGSGLDASNAPALLAAADGAIVGTSLKRGDAVERSRARAEVKMTLRSSTLRAPASPPWTPPALSGTRAE